MSTRRYNLPTFQDYKGVLRLKCLTLWKVEQREGCLSPLPSNPRLTLFSVLPHTQC